MKKTMLLLWLCMGAAGVSGAARPNIVLFYCDDLGMGDVGIYDPSSTVPTPHIDALAREGILFTRAHSPAAVCTPSRYGLMTGTYPFRTRFAGGAVLRSSYDPPLLSPDEVNLGTVFQRAGYRTAAFGKWHLGMKWTNAAGDGVARPAVGTSVFSTRDVDFSKPVIEGPLQYGFDYFFGLGSSINHGPYTFIENDRVTELPARFRKQLAINGRPYREGWVAASWEDDGQVPRLSQAALDFIGRQAAEPGPFFVYYASVAPHWPWVPPETLRGNPVRGAGGNDDNNPARNDMIAMIDLILGDLLEKLDDPNGDGDNSDSIRENTLVVFTSDNGADVGTYSKIRGQKGQIYEGGHRVPFIVSWPGRIPGGRTEDALIGQVDLYASLAELVGVEVSSPDSCNMLPVLLGQPAAPPRPEPLLVTRTGESADFAVLDGDWKLILKNGAPLALHNLETDPLEQRNLLGSADPFSPEQVETVRNRLAGYFERKTGQTGSRKGKIQ